MMNHHRRRSSPPALFTCLALGAATLLGATLPAPEAGAAEPAPPEGVRVGELAVDFTLPDHTGTPFKLSERRGRNAVLLAFYPKDFTGGCTRELSSLRDHYARFEAAGVEVVGLSVDAVSTHQRFHKSLTLPFKLLADINGNVAERYDALMVYNKRRMASREVVLIDRAGRVVFRNDAYKVGDDADLQALLAAVDKLR